jgi:hypothetical protein|tara:strand:- start:63 stop:392 length:330 start_codon:yes stop_codon:yes gene_type:complete
MEKIVEYGWAFISAVFWFFLQRLTAKLDDLEKSKASGDDLSGIRKGLGALDRRVDAIDHSTQLRLVPRDEVKSDVTLLHQRCNDLSERLCQKEDRIKTIRVTENEKKGK